MAIILAYDSGASGVDAGVWGVFSVESNPVSAPKEVLMSAVPLGTPNEDWNTAGWAQIEISQQTLRILAPMTAISLAPEVSGLPYQTLNSAGIIRMAGTIPGFRAVRWNLNRWVGKCRVRIYYIN